MKTRSQSALCAALLLALTAMPALAAAQVLSKAEEARLAVGQCYSACMARLSQGVFESSVPPGVIAEPLIDAIVMGPANLGAVSGSNSGDEAGGGGSDGDYTDDDGLEDWVAFSSTEWCEEVQDRIRLMDGCNAGCVDVEAAYGAADSEARKRFKRIFAEAREPLEAAGLWTDYASSPAAGTAAFDAACDAFVGAAE